MTITPTVFSPFAGSIGPLNRVTPFSHRDNATFLTIMKGIIDYLNETMIPETEAEIQRIIDEFNSIRDGDEDRFDQFVEDINALVAAINNRVGPESMHRVNLAADYTVNIDPTWPDAHPVRFQFTQDASGGRVVTYGAGIVGLASIDPTPLSVTEVELIPDGAGNWFTRVLNKPQIIDVSKEFGARPGGVFDNTVKFNNAMNAARSSKREVFIPAGVWFVSGEVDFSGVVIRGVFQGNDNMNGTVIRGSGSNIVFNQQNTTLDVNRMGLHDVRIENCATGFRVTYSIYSHFSGVNVIDANADAVIVGDNTIIGPIWNVLERVKATSVNGYGLRLAGMNWCNSNLFDTCFFHGTTGAINVLSVSGFGSLGNKFFNTEIRSTVGPGIVFNGTNRATTLEKCFIEPKGPGIVVNSSTTDLQLIGNIYGSTRNNVVGYGPYFVEHKAATFIVRVFGGFITTNDIPEQTNLRFIGSALPASMTLEYIAEPITIGIASTGYKVHDETVISAAKRTHRGDVAIKKYSAPSFEIGYTDGTKTFQIKRNGTQGGSDFGVEFINDGNKALTIQNNGMVTLNGHFSTEKAVAATVAGTIAFRIPVYNESQVQIGNIAVNTGVS